MRGSRELKLLPEVRGVAMGPSRLSLSDGKLVEGFHEYHPFVVVGNSSMAFYIVIEHLDGVCRRCSYLNLELPYDLLTIDVEALIMKFS